MSRQGFPQISSPLVDPSGRINQVWLQLLVSIWNRTGSSVGINGSDVAALALFASLDTPVAPNQTDDPLAVFYDTTEAPQLADAMPVIPNQETNLFYPPSYY